VEDDLDVGAVDFEPTTNVFSMRTPSRRSKGGFWPGVARAWPISDFSQRLRPLYRLNRRTPDEAYFDPTPFMPT
jgi:hypothetical protein